MKLYSLHQMLKSTFLGIIIGAIIAGCAILFLAKDNDSKTNLIAQEESKTESVLNNTQNEIDIIQNHEQEIEKNIKNSFSDSKYTEDEQRNIYVYEKCNEAVVNITTQVMGINWFLEPIVQDGGSGSGSIIDKRGYVVTNVHVINKANKINISLADGSSYEGRVIGKDIESDIAVLKFDPPENKKLKTIEYGDSNSLKVGQKVIAIGNPFALERTMTTGIISGLGRPIQESANVIIRNMIQTDAAINPGNSGGPLLDTKGKMVGINTMIISNSGSSAGIGFAVPVSTAKRVVTDLIKYGKVNRGKIYIIPVQMTPAIAQYAGLNISSGILVSSVKKGSNAEKAGIKGGTKAVQYGSRFNPTTIYLGGDIITGIDGITVRTYADYTSALEAKRPNDTVTITVYRNGKYEIIKVILDGSEENNKEQETTL